MASTTQHPHGPRPPTANSSHPPSTIAELASKALDGLWDEAKELKYYLKMAEKYRREAKEYLDAGDLENAFIFYAKAATLVLDKIPTHRDYDVKLRLQHKNNLGLNGQDILDQLAMIKEVLVERYQRWMAGEPPEQSQQPPQQSYESSAITSYTPSPTPGRRSTSAGRSSRARDRERSRDEREPQQPVSDDSSRWRADRNKDREEKERERERERRSRRNGATSGGIGSGYTMVASGEDETRRLHEEMRRREEEHRMLQDARRKDEERERERRRKEEKARQKRVEEEEGILRRQREADEAARMARAAPAQPPPAPQPAPAPPQQSSSLSSIASSSMASISTIGSSPSSLFAPQHTPNSSLTTTPNGSMYGSFYTPTKASSSHPPAPANGAGSSYRPPSNQSSPYPPPPASAPISNGGPSNGFPPPPASAPMGSGYPPYSSSSAKSPVTPTPTSTANAYSYAPQSHTDNTTPTTTNIVHPLPPLHMPPPPQSAPVYGTQSQQQQQPYMYNFRPQPQPNPTPERPPTQSSIYAPPQSVSQPPQQQQQAPRPEPQQQQPPAQQPQSQTRPMHAPQARSRPPSFLGTSDGISFLPLESPTKYEGDSTDSESLVDGVPGSRWHKKHHDHLKTPTRTTSTSSGPQPVTTTSPPPADGRPIEYPRLMSPHQLTQGYTPSLNSMFSPLDSAMSKMNLGSETLLFDQRPGGSASTLYPREALPPQSAPAGYAMYGMQQQQAPHHQYQQQRPSPHRPPLPNPPTQQPQYHYQAPGRQVDTIPVLKTVSLPRDCLDKFLSIAKVNTSLNRETCGLLLGKDKGHKYVVTTLLVPKQHSTSDTCTMDEEELVMQFTEERNLITLGWIHTHPSQSCFMSSVDLHTHSGFQRMLPESFAVVCAPRFSPNFGIFRLTDPPGLKTVLDCKATEAFHPHPDLPIYTDAEKGHVQMRDLPLEIVDIR